MSSSSHERRELFSRPRTLHALVCFAQDLRHLIFSPFDFYDDFVIFGKKKKRIKSCEWNSRATCHSVNDWIYVHWRENIHQSNGDKLSHLSAETNLDRHSRHFFYYNLQPSSAQTLRRQAAVSLHIDAQQESSATNRDAARLFPHKSHTARIEHAVNGERHTNLSNL